MTQLPYLSPHSGARPQGKAPRPHPVSFLAGEPLPHYDPGESRQSQYPVMPATAWLSHSPALCHAPPPQGGLPLASFLFFSLTCSYPPHLKAPLPFCFLSWLKVQSLPQISPNPPLSQIVHLVGSLCMSGQCFTWGPFLSHTPFPVLGGSLPSKLGAYHGRACP